MRIDSPNQSTRWKKELNSLPDATWLRTITRMKPIPAATANRMTFERRSRPEFCVRITMTMSATAKPAIACRDWVIAIPTRQTQKQACANSGGHRTQRRPGVRDGGGDAEEATGEVLVHVVGPAREDAAEVASGVLR